MQNRFVEKAKKEKSGRRSLREECRLILRGIKIWNEIVPGMWWIVGICRLVETILPYFGLYMSAALVNELSGECDLERLFRLAGITVVGSFVLSVLKRLLQAKQAVKTGYLWQRHENYLAQVQNHFQYEHLENPDVVAKRSEIFAVFNAYGGGLYRLFWAFPQVLQGIFDMVLSVSLTVSIFSLKSGESFGGFWGFVNSPAAGVVLLVVVMVTTAVDVKLSCAQAGESLQVMNGLAKNNTRWSVYGKLWGTDMLAFNMHRIVLEMYRKYNLRPEWIEKHKKIVVKYYSFSACVNTVLNIAVFLFTAAKAYIGVFGIGNFVLYQGTISKFISAVSSIAGTVGALKQNNQYLQKFCDYIDMPNDMYKGTLIVEKRDDIDYEIEFRDVSFQYPRSEEWALRHVNMKFKIGDKLAIVGENGSGKSTFIKLLCRLYDPTEGKILLNGIDITRYRYDEYMQLFSVVFQDYFLFDFSLGENVAASLSYDAAKVRECLVQAGLGEKLAGLEDAAKKAAGEQNVGEANALDYALGRNYDSEAIQLSGGERQKVALARALYKDAPFVVLDEPTAALDPIAEAEVYENFNRLVQNKTAVFISHRLSSCRFCHSIAVFDKGELIQQGSHEELVADMDGKYSRLWNAQAKYYTNYQ